MPLTRRSKIKWAVFITVDILLGATVLFLFLIRAERDEQLALRELGTSIFPAAQQIQPFSLQTQTGEEFTPAELQGQWSLVFFGFTHCPDVCPLSMMELDQFYTRLQQDSALPLPQVIMVTVDPQRDTPAQLGNYVTQYNPEFTGLTGELSEVENLAKQLYVVVSDGAEEQSSSDDSHAGHVMETMASDQEVPQGTFNHSGHISVINPAGELYAVMRLPHLDQNLLEAYRMLLAR